MIPGYTPVISSNQLLVLKRQSFLLGVWQGVQQVLQPEAAQADPHDLLRVQPSLPSSGRPTEAHAGRTPRQTGD